jgi:hypothetical protein
VTGAGVVLGEVLELELGVVLELELGARCLRRLCLVVL